MGRTKKLLLLHLIDFISAQKLSNTVLLCSCLVLILLVPGCTNSGEQQTLLNDHRQDSVGLLQYDETTGLVLADGIQLVKANCMNCHSPKLITQSRATKEGWEGMIRWMQAKHRLWDLGENEAMILEYLATHYAPEEGKGRRKQLEVEWYDLEL